METSETSFFYLVIKLVIVVVVGLPEFGLRKYMHSGHLAEFIWRYLHKEEDMFEVFLSDIKIYKPNDS